MNTVKDQPSHVVAEQMAMQGGTELHFERWPHLWALRKQTMFDRAEARHPQKVASNIARNDIARNLYRGCFGNAGVIEVIVLETRHGGR